MKKLFAMAFAAVMGCAACQQELVDPNALENETLKVYATIEDTDDTKTSLNDKEVYWTSGDRIAVFINKTLRKRFEVSYESVGTKDGIFSYDSDYIVTGKSVAISNNVAYYPFSEVNCAVSDGTYTLDNVTLPSTQIYAPASFGQGAFPMVAVTADTDDLDFAFKNLCGVLALQLKGYGTIKSITIKGNSNEVLSGKATVTASYGQTPEISLLSDGDKTVTLDCGESGVNLQSDAPTSFFIVLPPVSFDNGFTIIVTGASGTTTEYSTTKKNVIHRSGILRMPEKEYIGERVPQEGDYIDEYGVNHGQGVKIGETVWAPVNCGYHKDDFKYGKLYQWGRKYGQGYKGVLYDVDYNNLGEYSDVSVPEQVIGPVSLAIGQSKANEDKFYYNLSDFYDWCNPQNDNLWNSGTEANPVKTEFDPCPDGWRVPTYAELDELNNNYSSWTTDENGQVGYWFSGASPYIETVSQVFFPAAGSSGSNRGCIGGYWSSRPDRTGSLFLHFYRNTYVDMFSNYNRADGQSVRCVQDDSELIPVQSVTLNKASSTLFVGASEILLSTIIPSNANHQSAHWWSENPEVVTVDQTGKVTAVSVGTTTIYAMAGMQVVTCEVTVNVEPGTYFFDDFSWMKPYLDAYAQTSTPAGDAVGTDNPGAEAPNLRKIDGLAGLLDAFLARGYEDLNQSNMVTYPQTYYWKFGKTYNPGGLKLPAMEFERTKAIDAVLSFDWSAHVRGSGVVDDVKIVVEIEGEGICSDSQAKISNPISPDQEPGDFKWQNVKLLLQGVNNATRIIIRPTVLDNSDGIDQKRWYIDNIKVTKPDSPAVDYIDEYGINHGQGVKIGEIVWAPVNCGYHEIDYKYGKLYQWGRKYGQGYAGSLFDGDGNYLGEYSDSSVPEIIQGAVSLSEGQSKANENKLYVSDVSDWCTTHYDNLWNYGTDEKPVKTEYDPCPEGWRVPTSAEFDGLINGYYWIADSNGQSGLWFRDQESVVSAPQAFFPSAGLRNIWADAWENRGLQGIYWSSTPRRLGAVVFDFNGNRLDNTSSCNSLYGLSVRCVQE